MSTLEPIELKEFIQQTISDIEEGIDINKRSFRSSIDFDISVTTTQKVEGNVKIYVVGGKGETQKENLARIQFKVNPYRPPTKDTDLPRKAESDYNVLES